MRKVMLTITFVVAFVTVVVTQQAPDTKPKPAQLSVKVGLAPSIPEAGPRNPSVEPRVVPVAGATIILTDERGIIIGVETSNKNGLTYWPHQDEAFAISVVIVGRRLETQPFARNSETASVLIRLGRLGR